MTKKLTRKPPYRGLIATLALLAAALVTSEFERHWSLARAQGQLVATQSNLR